MLKVNHVLLLATATLTATLSFAAACKPTKSAEPTPSPTGICSTHSGMVTCFTGLAECLNEWVPVAAECNEALELPWCKSEDDVDDGTRGPVCFWRDPDTGYLWFNDGNGTLG